MPYKPWLRTRPDLKVTARELYEAEFARLGLPSAFTIRDRYVQQRDAEKIKAMEEEFASAVAKKRAEKAELEAVKAVPPPEVEEEKIEPIWLELLKEPTTKPELAEKLKPLHPALGDAELKEMTHLIIRVVKPKYIFNKGKMYYFVP